jgi:hypothetical protein
LTCGWNSVCAVNWFASRLDGHLFLDRCSLFMTNKAQCGCCMTLDQSKGLYIYDYQMQRFILCMSENSFTSRPLQRSNPNDFRIPGRSPSGYAIQTGLRRALAWRRLRTLTREEVDAPQAAGRSLLLTGNRTLRSVPIQSQRYFQSDRPAACFYPYASLERSDGTVDYYRTSSPSQSQRQPIPLIVSTVATVAAQYR